MKVKQFKSLNALQRELSKGGGGERQIISVPKEGIKVRFITEPDQWLQIEEHWVGGGFEICKEDCALCEDGRPSKRYITNAVDVMNKKVIALKLPITLIRTLLKRYDRYSTVMDRDYEISKSGTGKETEYDIDSPDGKSEFNFSRFEPLDLMAAVKAEYGTDDDDDDDDVPEPKSASRDDEDDDTPPWETKPVRKLGK